MQRNYRTPRTLADTSFYTGHPCVSKRDSVAGVVLATIIGIVGAVLLIHWAAA